MYVWLQSILGFDEKAVAHLMLLHGLASIFSQTVLLQPLMAVFREKGVIVIAFMGCILESVGFGLTAFYPKQWIVFALTAPGCLADLSFAAISSLKSVNCSEKVGQSIASTDSTSATNCRVALSRSKDGCKAPSTVLEPSLRRPGQCCFQVCMLQ